MSMSHAICKRRCRSLPLRLLHALECFSRVTKRHRGQETMVCVIQSLKWGFCPQSRLIFAFLSPIAVFHYPQCIFLFGILSSLSFTHINTLLPLVVFTTTSLEIIRPQTSQMSTPNYFTHTSQFCILVLGKTG